VFAVRDPGSPVEVVGWTAAVRCRLRENQDARLIAHRSDLVRDRSRPVYFANEGWVSAIVRRFDSIACGESVSGPAIVESPFTNVVLEAGAVAERKPSGSLSIAPGAASDVGDSQL